MAQGQQQAGDRPAQRPRREQVRADRAAAEQRQDRAAARRLFATCLPGLGQFVRGQLDGLPATATAVGFDGRADVVLVETDRDGRGEVRALRTIEDLFVEVGRADRAEGDEPRWIARRLWRPQRIERALSIWAAETRPLSGTMRFRVIARVLSEQAFLRTELRREMTQAVLDERPKWRTADPADVEIWVSEYQPGRFVAGLRLTDAGTRQHGGRAVERPGALRPTVAAAMVQLAGEPAGILLDPCCGSGTVLVEASAAGWAAEGADIDPAAVEVARRNVRRGEIRTGDARRLDRPDGSVAACASNLPFGQQYKIQGSMQAWLAEVLRELARVTRVGGRVVVLAPDVPAGAVPDTLWLGERYALRLLGTRTTIWAYDRTAGQTPSVVRA